MKPTLPLPVNSNTTTAIFCEAFICTATRTKLDLGFRQHCKASLLSQAQLNRIQLNDTDLTKQSHGRQQFIIDGKIVSKARTKCHIHFFLNRQHWADAGFSSKHLQKETWPQFSTDGFEWRSPAVLRNLKSLCIITALPKELVHGKNVVFARLQRFLPNKPTEWPEVLEGQLGIEPSLND